MTTLLIVDDNSQNLYMLQTLVEGHGYAVATAQDGLQALEIARVQPLDLVISDILMPVMDGFALCREWQSDARLKNIPFIFYTATYTDPKDERFALGLGAVRFIVKPAEPEMLMANIKEVLRDFQAVESTTFATIAEEDIYLKEYNERLIHKLEKRTQDLEKEIAERKIMEKTLRHAQRMEAIGTLASGIAHDFNNILTAIIGRSEIARERLDKPEKVAEDLEIIISAGKRASKVVSQIYSFSRLDSEGLQPVSMNLLIDEVQELLATSFSDNITVKKGVPADPPLILGDPTQLLQVVMNLCTNGCQAMGEGGGTLQIDLAEVKVEKGGVCKECPQLANGRYVVLEIRDNGCGMNEEMVEKIFDPFFTTKKKSEGTGLGLSVVHGVVRRHKGEIAVVSSPGEGSSFSIYFPVYVPSAVND